MPRSRNIKYEFFTNDELADNEPLGRLLFIGLWTLADYKGDLIWKERRIKAKILPYDDCDVNKLAINLDKSGFIRFYSDGDSIYVRVVNFDAHQNPHKNEKEKGSDIPEYTESMRQAIDLNTLTINQDKSGLNLENSDSNPADSLSLIPDSLSLIPDSLSLIPDSLSLIPDSAAQKKKVTSRFTPPTLEEVILYCRERQNTVDPNKFINHYEANGWMRGKNKIKDWKACVRTWEEKSNNNFNQPHPPQQKREMPKAGTER